MPYDNLEQLRQEQQLELNSLNTDPMFVDFHKDNFAVEKRSPAINAGINLNLEKDFFGESVPNFNIPDIGVAEFSGILFGLKPPSDTDPVMSVFPNPSSGTLNVTIDMTKSSYTEKDAEIPLQDSYHEIHVIDISGKTILTRFLEQTQSIIKETIDLSHISDGFYFVIYKMADKTITEKFILER
jgi:hypothetical protein